MKLQEIDFQPLFQWINQSIGTFANFDIGIVSGSRPVIINFDNLYGESGIFKAVIKEVSVGFFNFDFDEDTGKLWATVYLSYESWSGGSNGMQIGTCWFNPEEGWTFESSRERFEKFNS